MCIHGKVWCIHWNSNLTLKISHIISVCYNSWFLFNYKLISILIRYFSLHIFIIGSFYLLKEMLHGLWWISCIMTLWFSMPMVISDFCYNFPLSYASFFYLMSALCLSHMCVCMYLVWLCIICMTVQVSMYLYCTSLCVFVFFRH